VEEGSEQSHGIDTQRNCKKVNPQNKDEHLIFVNFFEKFENNSLED